MKNTFNCVGSSHFYDVLMAFVLSAFIFGTHALQHFYRKMNLFSLYTNDYRVILCYIALSSSNFNKIFLH